MQLRELENFLRKEKIIGIDESYDSMVDRVFTAISDEEVKYGVSDEQKESFNGRLQTCFRHGLFVPSTPILTNAGRYSDRALSACTVPPIEMRDNRNKLEALVNHYHVQGMGTGFNFDDEEDPVGQLLLLNSIAVKESTTIDRPVGNMAILSVDHPRIREYAAAKSGHNKNKDWKFNISVNLTPSFLEAVKGNSQFTLRDGTIIPARVLLDDIVSHAHNCGDPGLVFLDRYEQFNITPHLGRYISLAPCSEEPMSAGESCQFGYVNLAAFEKREIIDYDAMRTVVHDIVRMLDDALDISIRNVGSDRSQDIMGKKRRIGVGVCGFQDLLFSLGKTYSSDDAVTLAEDLMSFITYESKKASIQLARERKSFGAYNDPETRRDQILGRYQNLNTNTVHSEDWAFLKDEMLQYGIRNSSTTSIPPTGRSSMIIGASPSIEPAFSLIASDQFVSKINDRVHQAGYALDISGLTQVIEKTKSLQSSSLPSAIKDIYRTCIEILPESHLRVVKAFQKYVDNSISKTVNLPADASMEDVRDVYLQSHDLGLKGITVYRDKSKDQPVSLSQFGSNYSRHKVVVFEGIDGSGKSEVSKRVAAALGAHYIDTPTDEFQEIRKYINKHTPLKGQFLFYLTSNLDLGRRLQDESANTDIICARYYLSSLVDYSTRLGKGVDELLHDTPLTHEDFFQPDLTILLTVDPVSQEKRINSRNNGNNTASDALSLTNSAYRDDVRQKYHAIAKEKGWEIIDTSRLSIDQVVDASLLLINNLDNKSG